MLTKIVKKYGEQLSMMIKYKKKHVLGRMIIFKLNSHKFEQHLNSEWCNRKCPMCDSAEWSYDDAIFTPAIINENKGMAVGGKMLPLVEVTCMKCGNTLFINGLVAGAIDDDNQKSAEV